MNENKLIATVGLAVVVIAMMTSNQLSIHASPTTEDDGWTEGDYEGSTEEQEEQAQEDWEDAGRPGDDDNDNSDNDDAKGDDGEQIFTCSDGSTVTEDEECPSTGPNPYCDTPEGKAATICHDRYDTDENGIATCNDGTHKADPKDCKDATKRPLPYCDTPSGKAASSCHDRLDYDDVTGLAPCNDGTQKANYKDCKDASKNDDDNDLPICEYLVVKDCVVNEIGQKCLVGTSDDPCQDIFYGYDGDLKPGEKTFNPNSDNDNDNDSPQSVSTTTTIDDCDTRSYSLVRKLSIQTVTTTMTMIHHSQYQQQQQ